jgi:UDP-2-acetamido-3-amino-2,3-dideoxy-glucuronate N-acetyltransferase
LNIACVGTGYWGLNLVRNFASLQALGSVCDSDPTRAQKVADQYGVQARTFADILADSSVPAVAIATPAETHYSLARKALLAGKDVFVEKPITLRSEDCLDLVELAESRRRILMVGHLLEYHPAILKLKELIDDGVLGDVQYIYSNRLNLGKVRREENALWSFAPHDISIILMLLNGQLPIRATAVGGNYLQREIADVTVSCLEFAGGVRAHIFVSWLHPYKEQKLVVVGSKYMAAFDDLLPADKLRLYSKRIDLNGDQVTVQKPEITPVPYQDGEPLQAECRHFLKCIETRQPPRSDGNDGLRVLRILEACQESLKDNQPVPVGGEFATAVA